MNFWKNKERDFFKNNNLNVAVHIRRENKYDITLEPSRICPLVYYFNLINKIREKYKNNDKNCYFIYIPKMILRIIKGMIILIYVFI